LRISGSQDLRISGFQDLRISGFLDFGIFRIDPGFSGFQILKS
jgi:hypothetical protein